MAHMSLTHTGKSFQDDFKYARLRDPCNFATL